MRVKIVATRLSEFDPATGQHHVAQKGDVLTVPEPFGKHLCDRGWAEDVAGKYKHAAFEPGVAKVEPQKMTVRKSTTKGS